MDIKELELTPMEIGDIISERYHTENWRKLCCEVAQAQLSKVLSHPRFCWKAENQELPEGVGLCLDCTDSYKMLEAGFVKIESKEEVKGKWQE